MGVVCVWTYIGINCAQCVHTYMFPLFDLSDAGQWVYRMRDAACWQYNSVHYLIAKSSINCLRNKTTCLLMLRNFVTCVCIEAMYAQQWSSLVHALDSRHIVIVTWSHLCLHHGINDANRSCVRWAYSFVRVTPVTHDFSVTVTWASIFSLMPTALSQRKQKEVNLT